MANILSKTDYILYRECPKNVWLKIHRPEIYAESELSEFEKSIIETGNEVELIARKLFPSAVLIEGRGAEAQRRTQDLIAHKEPAIFQPVFCKDGFLAAIDVLEYDPTTEGYVVNEIKATNAVDAKDHYHDLAFQVNVLRKCGLTVNRTNLIHLNPEYVRSGELNVRQLFAIEDVTEAVFGLTDMVSGQMAEALEYISRETEPRGPCCCIYKGRSQHCSTFHHSNPDVPEYGVHDLARIGNSKKKLEELVNAGIFHLHAIPPHMELSEIQKNQLDAYILDRVHMDKGKIAEELGKLVYPLHFLDYETCPAAIPRFDGYSPYQQIVFQYSVHVLEAPDSKPKHFEFLHSENTDPSSPLTTALQQHIGPQGSVIVWNKNFECGRNKELGVRVASAKESLDSINARVYDLEDIFKKQYHVHKDFRGKTSIKKVLPVLVPDLTYQDLEIREGGLAAESWNRLTDDATSKEEKEKIQKDLLAYCGMDTYAMYAIWNHLRELVA